MGGFLSHLSASCVSFAVSGNTGVAPFLTLFLLSIIDKCNPDLLSLDATTSVWVSSWWMLVVLGIMTVLEFVAKCVPVVDEIVDSVLTFVVPITSVFATIGTLGLYNNDNSAEDEEGNNDVDDIGNRLFGTGALLFFQIVVIALGMVLSLSIHFFKMIVRLMGVAGCLTGCITVIEIIFTITTVTVSVFIRQIAIFVACLFLVFALYNAKKRFCDDKKKVEQQQQQQRRVQEQKQSIASTYV